MSTKPAVKGRTVNKTGLIDGPTQSTTTYSGAKKFMTHSLVADRGGLAVYQPKDEKGLVPLARLAAEPARYDCVVCKKKVALLVCQSKDPKKTEAIRAKFGKWKVCPSCHDDYAAKQKGSHLAPDILALIGQA